MKHFNQNPQHLSLATSNCEFALVLFLVAAHYLIFLRNSSDSFQSELMHLFKLNHFMTRVWIVPCGRQLQKSHGGAASMSLFLFAGSNNFDSFLFLLWILCFDFVILGQCRRFVWWMWLKTALNSTSIASITLGTISVLNSIASITSGIISSFNIHLYKL